MVANKIVNRQPECLVLFKAHSIPVLFKNIVFNFTFQMNNIFFKGSAFRIYITIKIHESGKINIPIIAFHHNLPIMTKCQKTFINELKLLTQL